MSAVNDNIDLSFTDLKHAFELQRLHQRIISSCLVDYNDGGY